MPRTSAGNERVFWIASILVDFFVYGCVASGAIVNGDDVYMYALAAEGMGRRRSLAGIEHGNPKILPRGCV